MQNEEYCFVIMPFSDSMAGVYFDVIKPAIESQGLKCIRADEINGSASIMRRVIENIVGAKVIIADLSNKNPNVFYELGVCHTLGNNAIVITQSLAEVPFDVSGYKCIEYKDSISGGRKLGEEIIKSLSTLPEWSTRPSNPVQDFMPAGERSVSVGQYTATMEELNALKLRLTSAQHHIANYEELKAGYEEMKSKFDHVSKKADELTTVYSLLDRLGIQSSGGLNQINAMQSLINQVENEVEVSIPVGPDENENASKKRIIFKKVNK